MEQGCEVKAGGWGCFEREEGEEGETAAVEGGRGLAARMVFFTVSVEGWLGKHCKVRDRKFRGGRKKAV